MGFFTVFLLDKNPYMNGRLRGAGMAKKDHLCSMASTPHPLIRQVSDTALWIAAFRAEESRRRDAVFNDALAERLAGEQGRAMVAATPHREAMAFAMVVRTCAIDRLVGMAIDRGVDTVINMGAGLDTRPYRMTLPYDLQWIEVDLPGIVRYKTALLEGEPAHCALRRVACDLSDDGERERLLDQLGRTSSTALVITEGLIAYLTSEQAGALSRSLHAVPSFRYWIMDYSAGRFRRRRRVRDLQKVLGDVKFRFHVDQPLAFFGRDGWRVDTDLHILDEADRIGRRLPLSFAARLLMPLLGKRLRRIGNRTYGYVLLAR